MKPLPKSPMIPTLKLLHAYSQAAGISLDIRRLSSIKSVFFDYRNSITQKQNEMTSTTDVLLIYRMIEGVKQWISAIDYRDRTNKIVPKMTAAFSEAGQFLSMDAARGFIRELFNAQAGDYKTEWISVPNSITKPLNLL